MYLREKSSQSKKSHFFALRVEENRRLSSKAEGGKGRSKLSMKAVEK
jgi:hypothetical protein